MERKTTSQPKLNNDLNNAAALADAQTNSASNPLMGLQQNIGNSALYCLIASQAKEGGVKNGFVKLYQYSHDGSIVTLTEEEYNKQLARAKRILETDFKLLEEEGRWNADEHRKFLKETHGIAGIISDILGDTVPPDAGIWTTMKPALEGGRRALEAGKLHVSGKLLKVAQESLNYAKHEWNVYIEKTTGGAQTAVKALEFTRDISFSIAIGAAAIVAAPVVAGAAGITGAGAAVTGGGALAGAALRGGSNLIGQGIASGKVNYGEVWSETWQGAKRGLVDASSSAVGLGAGRLLGLGVKNLGFAQTALRSSVVGGVNGAASGAMDSTLDGKSIEEIIEETAKGFAAGTLGGAFGGAAGKLSNGRSSIVKFALQAAGDAAGGAAGSVMAGGSLEDIKNAILSSMIAGRLMSSAVHKEYNTKSRSAKLELDRGPHEEWKVSPNEREPVGVDMSKPSGLELDHGSQPSRESIINEFEPARVDMSEPSGLELDNRPYTERNLVQNEPPSAAAVSPSKLELDHGPHKPWNVPLNEVEPVGIDLKKKTGLKLDRRKNQPLREVAHNEMEPQVDLKKKTGLRAVKSDKERAKLARMRPIKQEFGEPSNEKAGTGQGKGMHFHEFNAAEIINGLVIDYDPVAGRPRKVKYRVDSDIIYQKRETDGYYFSKDKSVEGPQPISKAFEKTGMDRGHLAQREAFKGCEEAESAADKMTNIVPMNEDLNEDPHELWRESERRSIDLVKPKSMGGGGYEHVTVEVEPIYSDKPKRLKDGTPIPDKIRRKIIAPDGTVLEDITHDNK